MAVPKRELFLESVVLALALGLWFAAAPASRSRGLSPAELIEDALPAKVTMARASKRELLSASCAVVRKDRNFGGGVTSVTVAARGEAAGDIVGAVLRPIRQDGLYLAAAAQGLIEQMEALSHAIAVLRESAFERRLADGSKKRMPGTNRFASHLIILTVQPTWPARWLRNATAPDAGKASGVAAVVD